jgi:aminoglycoside phosphotransferase (APT) family kinase protein
MVSAELDPVAILESLGVRDVTSLAPVTGGMDAAIWRVDHAGGASALRVFRAEQMVAARREAATMRAAVRHGLPVPAVEAEGEWRGRPVLLIAWVDGRPLMQEAPAHPWRAWALGTAFGRMQARIHAVPAPDILRESPRGWTDWAGPIEGALREQLQALALRDDALIHLDYHPMNVLVSGRQIAGVLDWTNAAAGDPRVDVARTYVILRCAPTRPDAPLWLTAGRSLLTSAWRRGYESVAGPLGDLTPFYAWIGAATIRDLEAKIGRPGIWLEQRHLEPLRQRVAEWTRRAGLDT